MIYGTESDTWERPFMSLDTERIEVIISEHNNGFKATTGKDSFS